MWRFSANLSFLFSERPFLERFAAAAAAGFRYVEFAYPYDYDLLLLRECLLANDLKLVMFNLPSGDRSAGERGLAAIPGREKDFYEGLEQAIVYARALDAYKLMCMVGVEEPGVSQQHYLDTLVERVGAAARRLAGEGLELLLEPFNPHDVPGYLLRCSADVLSVLDAVGATNLKLQFDLYHAQRSEGGLVDTLRSVLDRIGHIQIADSPDRGPPGSGELAIPYLLGELTRLGYREFVGLEYRPPGPTEASLGWLKPFSEHLDGM